MERIAWRQWDARTVFYVQFLPGEEGADWGYTTDVEKARPLSPYWQRRFRAYLARMGKVARFT